jgi:hypothetical protein
MRFKHKGCLYWWVSGLITAIAINYLIVGFIDIWMNIHTLLEWLQQSGVLETVYRLLGGR